MQRFQHKNQMTYYYLYKIYKPCTNKRQHGSEHYHTSLRAIMLFKHFMMIKLKL